MVQQPHPVTLGSSKVPTHMQLSDGTQMPMVAYGTFLMQAPGATRHALEVGYRHIDTARLYFNEALIGKEIAEWVAADPAARSREQLYLVSKVFNDAHRPADVRRSCQDSLRDLGCTYLDLYLIHWPDAFMPGVENNFLGDTITFDDQVTLADTWRAMESLVDDGLVRSIGVSNFSLRQVEEVLRVARIKPVCNQVEMHPYLPQRKLVEQCRKQGVQCTAYCPLGGPSAIKPNTLLTNPVVQKIAKETSKPATQVLTKWSMQRGVPALPKSSRKERIEDNFRGIYDWELSAAQQGELDALEDGTRFCAPAWKKWENDAQYPSAA